MAFYRILSPFRTVSKNLEAGCCLLQPRSGLVGNGYEIRSRELELVKWEFSDLQFRVMTDVVFDWLKEDRRWR